MGKNSAHRVNLNDFKERKDREGRVEIETDAGVFTIPPPEMWPDEVLDGTYNDVEIGKVLVALGSGINLDDDEAIDARYDEFKAAGGNAVIVGSIVQEVHGETLGK